MGRRPRRLLRGVLMLSNLSEEQALQQLEQLMLPRIEAVQRGEISFKSFKEIIAEARNEAAVS